jgi:N-carbamoyl-L-amino-acid hydrolase
MRSFSVEGILKKFYSEAMTWQRIMELSAIREPKTEGWTRRAFTSAYNEGRKLVRHWMEEAGLRVTIDPAANLIGCLPGADESLPPVLVGSHTDTVLQGGRFDGVLGVAAGIEVARKLRGVPLQRGLLVVDFTAEEPTEFGISTVGSRAFVGNLPSEVLVRQDTRGQTLSSALKSAGGEPTSLEGAAHNPGSVYAALELHIEQGPILEQKNKELGVVTGIVGIGRFKATARGRADHAGTTPMELRKDALTAMAEVVLSLERLCKERASWEGSSPLVGTVGKLTVIPNAPNVIPAWVEAYGEIRSLDVGTIDEIAQLWKLSIEEIQRRRGVAFSLEHLSTSSPVVVDKSMQDHLERVVSSVTPAWMKLPSGAGHDMNQMARIAPVGMLFVPCKEGRSHTPEEWCDPTAVEKGVEALYLAVKELCTGRAIL